MTPTMLLTYLGRHVAVNGAVDWVTFQARLSPFIEIREASLQDLELAEVALQILHEPRIFAGAPPIDSPKVALHGGLIARQVEWQGEELLRLASVAFRCSIQEPPTVTIYFDDDHRAAELELLRICRGILTALAQRDGWLRAHLAAVARGDSLIAFIGDKGAGKTSALLSLLLQMPELALVTNDKALIRPQGDGYMVAGIPYAVSIAAGSLSRLPILASVVRSHEAAGKSYYWPRDIASTLNCRIAGGGEVAGIIEVELNLDGSPPEATVLDATELPAAAHKKMFDFSEQMHPSWLLPRLGLAVSPARDLSIIDVPLGHFRGSPWGNLALLDLVEELLGYTARPARARLSDVVSRT